MKKLLSLKQPAAPFEYCRLYGKEKYSLSNMEMTTSNMPDEIEEGYATEVWSDRSPNEWERAGKFLKSSYPGDAFWNGVPHQDLLTFAQQLAREFGFEHPVTGARVVRFTNQGQYPVYRLDIVSGGVFRRQHHRTSYHISGREEYAE